MERKQAIKFLIENPAEFGKLVGFTKLERIHNDWIRRMLLSEKDETLQAHRGSYKTTCVSVALAEKVILWPKRRTLFMRKTDTDIKEVIKQTRKILESPVCQHFVNCIYETNLKLVTSTASEISTNLTQDVKGTAQLVGLGLGSSLTGKHFDEIFTDDIVNIEDRVSRAERDRTKLIYQELQNIKNRNGRIFNTGTPWHADDCFTLMPNATKYDCYSTGLMSEDEIEEVKGNMTASLFAANYELRHIAAEDVIFDNPTVGADPSLAEQGDCHIDAAYGGEDYTAFTICRKQGGKYYIFGKMWRKHVDECLPEIILYRNQFNAGKIWCEDNADKGYLAKELKRRGERAVPYHESQNKLLKITSYLKFEWKNVEFVAGTDEEYIKQILDYNENAEHDDAPDSLASCIRKDWKKADGTYQSILG